MADQKITPRAFDRIVSPMVQKTEKLWGAPSIARHLGVSEETVRAWAKKPGIPIFTPQRGTYFATRSELDAWLRQKPDI